ncbi:mediator of RNA polymerase II transcription subunit 30-like [Oratosquilla oratoria]|uniref:mediator of RNA polymerase II transcription subunit 30-like n=1 Tax=Oratosquilla oratoria TaxID=337810 RepID=UPI003F7583DC
MMRNTYTGQITPVSQTGVVSQGSGGSTGGGEKPPMNTASLCKVGLETVQDIVMRTIEITTNLKGLNLPNGTGNGLHVSSERKIKIQEHLQTIRHLFKRLKIIYDRVNENCAGMEYTHIESLIPYKDEVDNRPDQKKMSETYRRLADEARELREQLCLKARYVKEVIDQLRKIIWEVNTMLAVRSA